MDVKKLNLIKTFLNQGIPPRGGVQKPENQGFISDLKPLEILVENMSERPVLSVSTQ